MTGQEDVEHAPKGKGGAVPDILHPGDGPPSLGNVSVWDPRHNSDHYMVLGCLPSASLTNHKQYLGGPEEVAIEASNGANERGRCICGPTEGRPKSEGERGEIKLVDLDRDVETRRRESLRAPGSGERTGYKKNAGARHQGEPGGG